MYTASIRRSTSRNAVALSLAAALLALMSVLTGAAPAQAASGTSQTVSNVDSGWATVAAGANLQKAPYGACGTVTHISASTKVWLWCTVENDYGNLWAWVRIDGTQTYGWAYYGDFTDGDLSDTSYWCPGEPS
ncbi:hypothetical protein [Streptomyces sp. Root369]|uniref:hypothetical protein n=1 Tax=Streptomyces sp. Root369 TaxID=1736523 RepID=UPI000A4A9B94|nr:hypothetical protein [Streptomyces sp. Root369]